MDVEEKYPGYTHIALTVSSLDEARSFMQSNGIDITGSFSFENMNEVAVDPRVNFALLVEEALALVERAYAFVPAFFAGLCIRRLT